MTPATCLRTALLAGAAALLLAACPKATTSTSGAAAPAPTDTAQAGPAEPDPATSATFQGRTIDIAPHVAGFPYRSFHPFAELGVMLYMRDGEERTLMSVPLVGGELDLAAGKPVNDIDWNTRNLDRMIPLPKQRAVLFMGDEDNAEEFDVYELHLEDGQIEKLTDVPYVYGIGLDEDRDRFAYVARYPEAEGNGYLSCLHVKPLDGGEAREVLCDDATAPLKFVWTDISFSPDGGSAYIDAYTDSDRNRMRMLRVDLATGEHTALLDDVKRSTSGILEHWLDDDTFVYFDNASGFTNLGLGEHSTGQLAPLTAYEEDVSGAWVLPAGSARFLVVIIRRPTESLIQILDSAGAVRAQRTVDANLYALSDNFNTLYLYQTSRSDKMKLVRLMLHGEGGFILQPFLKLPEALSQQLVHCRVERVQIPTFDVDPATGAPRLLHAYLSTPIVPPAEGEARLAGIVAFYGGDNYFDVQSQILCQAGIATLSPAVRGSWGFGAEFYGLNDGDLGGDEIVDLQWMARWLEQEKGYEPRSIGLYGGSHGGYATMRGLTFPPETNGRNSDYDFGWGVSFFGFSDIATFWEKCNIPDWVLLEAGDPKTEADKLRDRSPLHHVDLLDSPLLLLHGENDQRVPVQESRQFQAACDAAGKPCTYAEFPGQGHGLKGVANQVKVWRAVLDFLTAQVVGAGD